jgi:CDP-diacylglycerol--glycerol-3-phosphate 3-phosphatidyltransferase
MAASIDDKAGNKILNVPNQLTAARLVLSIVVFALIPLKLYPAALIVFVIAAGTDWVDGYWARRFNQVTKLGRIFDPFVDKILICGVFVFLAVEMRDMPWYASVTGWMAVVVVGREMLVTALRGFIEQSGSDFSAKMSGKLKMVFQCVAVVASLMALMYGAAAVPGWLFWTLVVFVWLAVLSTIYSGVGYIFAAAKVLRS